MTDDYAVPFSERPEVVLPDGRVLGCVVCGGRAFDRREVKLNTTGMSFMNLDWANKSADGAVCRSCGYVHSFLAPLTWRRPTDSARDESP